MPVWEVAQMNNQAPVVTWEITLETHRLRFSRSTRCGPDRRTAEQFRWCSVKRDGRKQTTFETPAYPRLMAEAEFLDHGFIAIGTVGFEIVEQATPLADQHEKTAARAVVLLVHLEVFRQ